MSVLPNREIILASRPNSMPNLSNFALRERHLPNLKQNEVLIRSLYLSVDPYMRGRMGGRLSSHPPFELNECLTGKVIGKIVESKNPLFKVGDVVKGRMGWADYSIANGLELEKINFDNFHLTAALNALGSPGMTAYFGILDLGQPKIDETVAISGAAGAVGMIVGQIAKIKGCRVVGITGSVEKTEYLLKNLGFDAAINYKSAHFAEELEMACPKGVDVYFDNVGGHITDQVLRLINKFSRIVLCGQISTYNFDEPEVGLRPFRTLIVKSAVAKGLIVWDYKERYQEALQQITQWMKEGKLKNHETIIEGLENAPKAFLGLFNGENIGKQLVIISD